MSFPTFYTPHASAVQNVITGRFTVVTTTSAHGLSSGYVVKLFFPPGEDFGMSQASNGIEAVAGVVDAVTLALFVDTTGFDPFVPGIRQPAQIIPIGTVFYNTPPLSVGATDNNNNIIPEYSWTNTTFPWVNSTSLVRH